MLQADREEDAMGKYDGYVSPYLRRPLRSYEEVMREQAERARGEIRSDTANGTATRDPARKGTDDVEPRR